MVAAFLAVSIAAAFASHTSTLLRQLNLAKLRRWNHQPAVT